MKTFVKALVVVLILSMGLASCSFPSGQNLQVDENTVNTSVAQTLSAMGSAGSVTATAQAGATATSMPLPTAALPTVAPTAIPPTPLPTEDTCNRAKWIEDVTVPDGSVYLPNATFTKTWRIQNVGTCTWNTSYAVVYSGGDHMNEPAVTAFLGTVAPGATVDLSVPLKSPAENGEYTTYFMLRSDTGVLFGTGATFSAPVFAQIKVIKLMLLPTLVGGGFLPVFPLETLVYSFGDNYCAATWKNASGGGNLACPGSTSDSSGYVVRNDNPVLSNGTTYSGVALVTHPQWIDGGSIAGIFPLITVENGMKFRATIGCRQGGAACDVRYFLRYYEDGVAGLKQLAQWDIKYTDAPLAVDVDLSALAGKKINVILQVVTNGSPDQDWAQWVNPRVIK
jgi:hypothetical protein